MTSIAVDVVLLPPKRIMDLVVKLNREMRSDELKLNKHDYLPHITLAMGCMNLNDLDNIKKEFNSIASSFRPLNLTIERIGTRIRPDKKKVSSFIISKTKDLQLLHEEVMKKISPHFTYEVTLGMFHPPIRKIPLSWRLNWPRRKVYKNFSPHMAIGYGKPKDVSLPINFEASRIALCHLGKFCTCRRILIENNLTR